MKEGFSGTSSGPGGIGSYLSRREFGSNEDQQQAAAKGPSDSGYQSHGSGGGGGGAYPKMQLPVSIKKGNNLILSKILMARISFLQSQAPIESFTMSVDRGFLGRPGGDKELNQYRSMDDLSAAANQKNKGMELVRMLRESEKSGFTPEDLQVALNHCGDANPVQWLKDNWTNMMDTVVTLASNVGHEAEENTIGTLSKTEAREALRKHKGNIWAAVTECVEGRQAKVTM